MMIFNVIETDDNEYSVSMHGLTLHMLNMINFSLKKTLEASAKCKEFFERTKEIDILEIIQNGNEKSLQNLIEIQGRFLLIKLGETLNNFILKEAKTKSGENALELEKYMETLKILQTEINQMET